MRIVISSGNSQDVTTGSLFLSSQEQWCQNDERCFQEVLYQPLGSPLEKGAVGPFPEESQAPTIGLFYSLPATFLAMSRAAPRLAGRETSSGGRGYRRSHFGLLLPSPTLSHLPPALKSSVAGLW